MTAKKAQDTEKKQSTHKRNTSGLIPFKPGPDARRNISGRNVKGFDDIRKLFQGTGNDIIELMINGKKQKMTRFEAIALSMSSDKKHMRDFLEYAVGKVPQAVEGEIKGEIILRVVREATKKNDA